MGIIASALLFFEKDEEESLAVSQIRWKIFGISLLLGVVVSVSISYIGKDILSRIQHVGESPYHKFASMGIIRRIAAAILSLDGLLISVVAVIVMAQQSVGGCSSNQDWNSG
jgi:hypothetical protein